LHVRTFAFQHLTVLLFGAGNDGKVYAPSQISEASLLLMRI